MRNIALAFILIMSGDLLAFGQKKGKPKIEITVNEADRKADVIIDGELFTSYIYPDNIKKPVLWPLMSSEGNMLTRSYPLIIKEGDRTDHPHHIGIWLNYGDVNGLDFWNNSEAIAPEKRTEYGTIYHNSFEKSSGGKGSASMKTKSLWKSPNKDTLIEEETIYDFKAYDNIRIIDRATKLTAVADKVEFKDNKEGMFAIRVARELELPSEKPTELMDSHGEMTKVAKMDNTYVKGNYRSSEGIEGAKVWGTRGRWMKLSSEINGESVTLVIIDNPSNVGYPTYWHARDYGLFAANPLGQKIFSEGKEELNFTLKKGQSTVFKYRLVIASGNLSDNEIKKLADDYAKK